MGVDVTCGLGVIVGGITVKHMNLLSLTYILFRQGVLSGVGVGVGDGVVFKLFIIGVGVVVGVIVGIEVVLD